MLAYDTYPFGRREALGDGWVIATYLVSQEGYEDILQKAGNFAVGQTVGTWVSIPGISREMTESRQGRVLQLEAVPGADRDKPSFFILRIAFPTVNFGNSLSMMMTSLTGNDVSTSLHTRLLDLELTGDSARLFPGPRQGMENLRQLAGVEEKRPLVLNMIKPCTGFSVREGTELFRLVAMGGVDLVKDDELLGSPSYNNVYKRTAAYLQAAKEVMQFTGKQTLYIPNISGTPNQMQDNAKAVLEAGASACMVNFVYTGLDALRELADAYGDQLFILAHYAGVSIMYSQYSGISNSVYLGLLPRFAGAHGVMTMYPEPNNDVAVYDFYRTIQAQKLPIPGIKPVVSAVGGGVTPINQESLQHALGSEFILGIGGAIQGHPMGATQGAQAAMTAVCATSQGRSLWDAAQHCPSLLRAMEIWSPFCEDEYRRNSTIPV